MRVRGKGMLGWASAGNKRRMASGPWREDGPTGRMEGRRERIRIFLFF
jgi:hypothetical protein